MSDRPFTDGRVTVQVLLLLFATALLSACDTRHEIERPVAPNVLLVVVDDMGYSDLGVYGGEIDTPSIDAVARDGVVLTNFHANATCTVSRAMLLTGIDNHAVGFGANPGVAARFPAVRNKPGYRGEFVEGVESLATRFQEAGYLTYLSGKWHLGKDPDSWPPAQGYVRSFFFDHSGASHFSDRTGNFSADTPVNYWEDDEPVEELPESFFSSTFYTEKLISYIESGIDSGQPFFAHLAYTAPHWPLQVPDDWLDKYEGRYDVGWEQTRLTRIERMVELGVISDSVEYVSLPAALGSWEDLPDAQRRIESRRMELYAAMIAHLDQEFGRLIEFLKDEDIYDNTIVVLLSDNGPEGNDVSLIRDNSEWVPDTFDLTFENMGRQGSYVWLGRGWAHVSAGPLSLYKSYLTEGGVRVPAIVRFPHAERSDEFHSGFVSILDVAPTLLEAADIDIGESTPMQGKSQLRALRSTIESDATRQPVAMEVFGGRAVFDNQWKLLWFGPPIGSGSWQLFDLATDPGETRDLAASYPEVVDRMSAVWDEYAVANDVYRADVDFGYGRYPDQTRGDLGR